MSQFAICVFHQIPHTTIRGMSCGRQYVVYSNMRITKWTLPPGDCRYFQSPPASSESTARNRHGDRPSKKQHSPECTFPPLLLKGEHCHDFWSPKSQCDLFCCFSPVRGLLFLIPPPMEHKKCSPQRNTDSTLWHDLCPCHLPYCKLICSDTELMQLDKAE